MRDAYQQTIAPVLPSTLGGISGSTLWLLLLNVYRHGLSNIYWNSNLLLSIYLLALPCALIGLVCGLASWRFRLKRRGWLPQVLGVLLAAALGTVAVAALFGVLNHFEPPVVDLGGPPPLGEFLLEAAGIIISLGVLVGGGAAVFAGHRSDD